jgi:predicted dehydrogenase
MERRDFIKQTALLGGYLSIRPEQFLKATTDTPKARLAFIGVGMRGAGLLQEAVSQGQVDINAVCDINPGAIDNAKAVISKSGLKAPVWYSGEHDFEKIVQRDDVDGVIIATPWNWHLPMALASLKAGKYTGCEVISGLTVEEIWELVHASEKTGTPYMMLENVCYRRDVMAVLNMARKDMFGQITYAECGYQHDLREVIFNDGVHMMGGGLEFGDKGINEAHWRTQSYIDRNADLYPTHGIGPVSQVLNITRGNQFAYLTSMSSPSASLHQYILDQGGPLHHNAGVKFKCGDVVTTLIKCTNGEMVKMTFDTCSPRPYSLGFRIQGTEGIWTDEAQGIYFQKLAPEHHQYEGIEKYIKQYDHPYWAKYGHLAEGSGHGGMDYFIIREFVECVRYKKPFLMDVYDAATWSVMGPLSQHSIAQNSAPVAIPDFTRGKWKTRKPIFGLNEYFVS